MNMYDIIYATEIVFQTKEKTFLTHLGYEPEYNNVWTIKRDKKNIKNYFNITSLDDINADFFFNQEIKNIEFNCEKLIVTI